MFLKALTLKGFKSFADPTTLVFEPGVTVIVGPNGSGKSNVVDAVAWALGAQAPTSVRSAKMDDVIFAGTASRAALGRAEVSLSIDNSTRQLPIEFEDVTITRTLFRSGESTYAINGVPCRLLDVQELLSDTGVGRQQHVIVSQRQIDGVLSARPEDRREIIEEAAGVLKYRRRKEKSQRRLEATEANLTRLADVLREIRRQLRPLERQATAARRHGGLVEELSILRRHLLGREIQQLRSLVSRLRQDQSANRQKMRQLVLAAEALDRDLATAETELAAVGGTDSAEELGRFEGLVERLRGIQALLGERKLRLQRERNAGIDSDVVATLEAEAARLSTELAEAQAEQATQANLEHSDLERTEPNSQPNGEQPVVYVTVVPEHLEQRRVDLMSQLELCWSEAEVLQAAQQARQTDLEAEQELLRQAKDDIEQAQALAAQATAEVRAWQARHEALSLALDEARDQAGAERLAGVQGVVGTLLEVVEVDRGFEAAFEAAAGEAVAAVVATDSDAAVRAIATLKEDGVSGAVLALGGNVPTVAVPSAGTPLRPHVRSDLAGMDKLLDILVGAVGVVETFEEGIAAARADATAVLVTRTGDRFGASGWRVGVRRLGVTRGLLREAEEKTAEARSQIEKRNAALDFATGHHKAQQAKVNQAQEALRLSVTAGKQATTRAGDLERKLRHTEEQIAEERSRQRMEYQVQRAHLAERCRLLTAQHQEIEQRLAQMASARVQAAARRQSADIKLSILAELDSLVAQRFATANSRLVELRRLRDEASRAALDAASQLEDLRKQRSQTETELGRCREADHASQLEVSEAEIKLTAAVERCRRDLNCEPQEAVNTQCPELFAGVSAADRIRTLEQELRIMGPVNPLALEEFEALSERHSFTQAQIDDIRQSRRELRKVIRKIDEEIIRLFSAAYADVSRNFVDLFETLFPNGEGKLRLTRPDELLETGVDVEARPSGKNVRRLSLLSGGERSLAAMAFLFAVFRSRPSPFYVMDEVEAALDDVNLHRFLKLVDTFRSDAQLLVVSHQKRTMEAADCLYGVSMKPGGSSKVLSEKLVVASNHEVLLQPSLQ
ncbi:MAG: AAA family ATPase [bacterium]|nr:AAA family ATPase [bacterium]